MTQQEQHEALVYKVALAIHDCPVPVAAETMARAAIAVIYAEMQNYTNEMLDAGLETDCWTPAEIYPAMLAASALNPEATP